MEDHGRGPGRCSSASPLDDLALLAAVDGEAGAEVMAHLQNCSSCMARAREFAALQGMLRKRLYRMFCPTSDELADFQQGLLEEGRRAPVGAHVANCPHCARELRLLSEAASALAAMLPAVASRPRRVVARLLAPRPFAPLGVGYSAPGSAHYVYRAENLQLLLDIAPGNRPGHLVALGMLIPDGNSHATPLQATAILASGDGALKSAPLDERGAFTLDDLASGLYSLTLRLPDCEVVVESLRL